ncbi:hypothetical protein GQ600_18942 [Phytophthora cactorum]|nr:hypothetical protein GQ600_18942 [Phytophthora cactorum]
MSGRKLRDHTKKSLNYMLVTLGIEKDDESDEDFVVDDVEEEYKEEGGLSFEESDAESTQTVAPKQPKQRKQKSTVDTHSKQMKQMCMFDTQPKKRTQKRTIHTQQGEPSPKQRKLGTLSEQSNNDESGNGEGVGQYKPRVRLSEHLEELQSMVGERGKIKNTVPPFPSGPLESWDAFEREFKKYKEKYNLKFRVRSSEKTDLYNRTHDDQIPTDFEWTYKTYRCTHGVSQGSRSKGHRNRKSRYCGCQARLTAAVTRVVGSTYTIVIRNENHTHTHPTSRTQASSYLTTKTLPLDDQDRENVKTLADARVSSTLIANFLNERIGCKVTPQQTRNLIRSIMGQNSGEDRMKDMLHALRQLDGSDVLVIQDQMDVTCGIVMQTKVQKLMFERWGETLAMDFTHGTNNLGYHLGACSLVIC